MKKALESVRACRFGAILYHQLRLDGINLMSSLKSDILVQRFAAFSDGATGGNPAGIVLGAVLPEESIMRRIAADVGFSETAFGAPVDDGWRVRYFSPESEVPFCGHATIALGAALAMTQGDGVFTLKLNNATITVEGRRSGGTIAAALQSPPTRSSPVEAGLLRDALTLFGYSSRDLDSSVPPALAHAGADHLILALKSRARLAEMHYDLSAGRELMNGAGIVTIMLLHAEAPQLFHARNPFASGGVYEDPATGAAAAALAGYLRDIGWPHGNAIEIVQGEDMGMRSRIRAEISPVVGASIRVSGTARVLSG
jgi:PhzF family phenazine biosynthesis protein